MAINTATIQHRRGRLEDFNPEKLMPGEIAVITDERSVHMGFPGGETEKIVLEKDFTSESIKEKLGYEPADEERVDQLFRDKADYQYVDKKVSNVKVDLTGYAKEDYVDAEIEELNKKIVQETGKLSQEIDDLKNQTGNDSGTVEVAENIEIVATEGKFAKWTTGEASGGNESSVNWASHSQFIPVVPGETLRITCKCANACPGVVFYSTNIMSTANAIGYALENPRTGDPISGSTNRYTYTEEDVVVPNGATYAILNNADNYNGWKCQRISFSSSGGSSAELDIKYEIAQLERRLNYAEKNNDFAWGTFDKSYFVFVHDDSREFITTAYNAFHSKGVPLSSAAIAPYLNNVHNSKTVKEWLDLIVADGGEVLCHYSYDLLDSDDDMLWYQYVVDAKKEFENNGFNIRGLILAGSSDVNSAKGEKFCRKYFDYADKVGTSLRYNLGRKGMWTFATLDDFKARIDSCAGTPGIYAFGFHGNRDDETWITEDSLKEIIDYVSAKDNCEITTYSAVFDSIGTTVLEKRITALENAG